MRRQGTSPLPPGPLGGSSGAPAKASNPSAAPAGPPRPQRSLRERALALLSQRERTRAELQSRLLPYAESRAQLGELLDDLIANGLLSDRRFVEAKTHALERRYGAAQVRRRLEQSGASPVLIREALAGIAPGELARARAVWAKRFGELPGDALERAKQQRFLHARGFPFDVIRRVVGGDDDE
jgi:regulatory protein